jgi:phospholipid/cholesterol/gamma-HCH transport system ATP-binding protein
MNKNAKINVHHLYKSFGTKKVLEDVCFTVEPGQSLALIGGSGTGKSVILKCILKLLSFDKGGISIDGTKIAGISERKYHELMRNCGVVFQGSALFDSLKIWENVAFSLLYHHWEDPKKAREKAIETLIELKLDPHVADLYPAEISGGMQRRVALARAIISKPSLLFFDEPTTGLDPIMSGVINELIVQSVKSIGASAITVTHDMASVRHIADTVILLHKGTIVWQGKAEEMESSDNPFIHQFVRGSTQGPLFTEND